MSSFDELPAELMLEVLGHLKPIPAYATEGCTNPSDPRSRENVRRIPALLIACMTSKKLFVLAEPVLYSRLIFYMQGWSTYSKIFCVVSALLRKPQLAQHIQYLENSIGKRREDADPHQCCHMRGWGYDSAMLMQAADVFWKRLKLSDWLECFRTAPEYALFAWLIALSPNVSGMSLDLEKWARTPWFIQPSRYRGQFHGFSKLKTLRISTDLLMHKRLPYCYALELVPMFPALKSYQHKEICHAFDPLTSYTTYRHLVSIRLENCQLQVKDVAEMIRDSPVLQEFVCQWHMKCQNWAPHWEALLSALHSTSNTLQVLELRLGQDCEGFDTLYLENMNAFINDTIYIQQSVPQPTGFTALSNLTTLFLSDVMLLGQPKYIQPPNTRPDRSISLCLPSSLEHLIIQADKILLQDNTLALWDLVRDLPLLPALRKVEILGGIYNAPFKTSAEKTAEMVARFGERGVVFVPLDWLFERRN